MERPVCSHRVYKGKIVSVRIDTVITSDGHEAIREVVERPDTVSVVAIDDNDDILLVRQYRYAAGQYTLEIPAGTIDPGETPEDAARRELREETGYDCGNLIRLITYFPSIGYSTEKMTVYLATDLVPSPLKGDEAEIKLERLPFKKVLESILKGTPLFTDAKSITGVLLAMSIRRRPSW